jgi:hypothetical protein
LRQDRSVAGEESQPRVRERAVDAKRSQRRTHGAEEQCLRLRAGADESHDLDIAAGSHCGARREVDEARCIALEIHGVNLDERDTVATVGRNVGREQARCQRRHKGGITGAGLRWDEGWAPWEVLP